MNIANKITIFRVIMVPIFMFLLLQNGFWWQMGALLVFIIASLTDMIDGKIARKRNEITNFGKFADPLADKILTTSAFVIFLQNGITNVWAVMIILAREFVVAGVRLTAVSEGRVIAASMLGKLKTVSQMVAIIATIIFMSFQQILGFEAFTRSIAVNISSVFIWISVIFTVWSGVDYVVKNHQYMKME